MSFRILILILSVVSSLNASGLKLSEASQEGDPDGRSLLLAGEFKRATHAFENALKKQPDSAVLHYWLGVSYGRLSEVSSSLFVPKAARKARHHLEEAVRLDPRNDRYLRELFDFYVDSPEWFHGGWDKANALVERICANDPGAESTLRWRLRSSQRSYSGPGWWIRKSILITGDLVPTP